MVVGCVWEMQIVSFETEAWTAIVLGNPDRPEDGLRDYLGRYLAAGGMEAA